jgi:hypothetical protein
MRSVLGQVMASETARLRQVELVPVARHEKIRFELLQKGDMEGIGAAHSERRAKGSADLCAINDQIVTGAGPSKP